MDVEIRTFQEEDYYRFTEKYSDLKYYDYFRFYNPTKTKWSTLTTHNGKDHFFVIADASTDELIGTIFAQRRDESFPYKVELSTLPQYSKQGCGKQAFKLLMEYLKDNLDIDNVMLSVDYENESSMKFIESLKKEFDIDTVDLNKEGYKMCFVKEKKRDIDKISSEDEER